MHKTIKERFDDRSDQYYSDIQDYVGKILHNGENAFPAPIRDMVRQSFPDYPDLRGKRVIVASSGDNGAAFGFHLMGATVTSCDLSDSQLNNAKKIADKYAWDIEFIQQDSMTLAQIPDEHYDLLYTSNGVHVWIHDLAGMYKNFYRVLKAGGRYIMGEIHPFHRPFHRNFDNNKLTVEKPYSDIGPHPNEGVFTYSWRLCDFINGICDAGFRITRMEEFEPGLECWDSEYLNESEAAADNYRKTDWTVNERAALPAWFGLCAVK